MPGTHCRTWLPEGTGFPDFLLKVDLVKMEKTTCSDTGMVLYEATKLWKVWISAIAGAYAIILCVLHLCGKSTISFKKCKGCSRFRGPIAQMEEADGV